ncbi:peroxiredoxin [Maribellus mangrovi]|uniref:peroxiredoxin n=1 Tax=Maribellus mangrovi TaxID=3133146 RepID=UPI0030EB4A89
MKTILILIATISILLNVRYAQDLEVGDKAPSFSAVADDGFTWDSDEYLGKKFIVVYFYPAAMTGGCTAQACAYRDMHNEIDDADAVVVGVSGDNVEGLKLFKKANNLNFPLLSDSHGEIANKFGVPTRDGGSITREIDGESFDLVRGVTSSRWTFIIGKDGNIVYKNTDVDVTKDSREILEFIKNNS